MTKAEAQNFVERVLKGLWPEWKPIDIQLSIWIERLQNCEPQRAKIAVENVWRTETIQHKRPPQGRIFEALSQCADTENKPKAELPQTTVYIRCIEPPANNPHRSTEHKIPVYPDDLSKIDDPDYVRSCGHGLAQRFTELYGGLWAVVVGGREEPSGLTGKAARDKAFKDILDGPDTKTKRWLQNYLDGKERKKGGNEPVDFGTVALQAIGG